MEAKLTSYEVEAVGKWPGKASWSETEHPRAADGRFGQGGKKPSKKLPSQTLRVNVRLSPSLVTTKPLYLHQNPGEVSRGNLIVNPRSESGLHTRALVDKSGNVFAWDANDATHEQVEKALRRRSILTDGKYYYSRSRVKT